MKFKLKKLKFKLKKLNFKFKKLKFKFKKLKFNLKKLKFNLKIINYSNKKPVFGRESKEFMVPTVHERWGRLGEAKGEGGKYSATGISWYR